MKVFKQLSILSALFLMSFSFTHAQDQEVSDNDLKTFVTIYKQVQQENENLQAGMMDIVQENGLEIERFNEIYEASMTPEKEVNASEEELKKHENAMEAIEQAQTDFQGTVTKIIEKEGFTLEKYQQVFAMLQSDEELQQKFSEFMQRG